MLALASQLSICFVKRNGALNTAAGIQNTNLTGSESTLGFRHSRWLGRDCMTLMPLPSQQTGWQTQDCAKQCEHSRHRDAHEAQR